MVVSNFPCDIYQLDLFPHSHIPISPLSHTYLSTLTSLALHSHIPDSTDVSVVAIITICHPLTVQLWLLCILIFFLGEGEAAKVSKFDGGDDEKMEILENK